MYIKSIVSVLLTLSLFIFSASTASFAADGKNEAMSSVQSSSQLNINTASNEQLASIKGLGDKKAQAIIDYRALNGDFTSLDQLVNVKGIGQTTLNKITPFITL